MTPIRLGRMAYINTLPVDWGLVNGALRDLVTLHRGAPTTLNRLLTEGHLDASPVSSVAAVEHAADWLVLDHLCIGCRGEVGSVILQSDVPIEELEGRSVAVTAESATAARLLQVLLARHWKVQGQLTSDNGTASVLFNGESSFLHKKVSPLPLSKNSVSVPLDRFRRQRKLASGQDIEVFGKGRGEDLFTRRASPQSHSLPRLLIGDPALKTAQTDPSGFIYDLGKAWWDYTGLGFVFGLWCVRREFVAHHPEETRTLCDLLRVSRAQGVAENAKVAAEAARVTGLTESKIKSYFTKLVYDLDDELWDGLNHFLGLLGYDPGLLQRLGKVERWTERLGVSGES